MVIGVCSAVFWQLAMMNCLYQMCRIMICKWHQCVLAPIWQCEFNGYLPSLCANVCLSSKWIVVVGGVGGGGAALKRYNRKALSHCCSYNSERINLRIIRQKQTTYMNLWILASISWVVSLARSLSLSPSNSLWLSLTLFHPSSFSLCVPSNPSSTAVSVYFLHSTSLSSSVSLSFSIYFHLNPWQLQYKCKNNKHTESMPLTIVNK